MWLCANKQKVCVISFLKLFGGPWWVSELVCLLVKLWLNMRGFYQSQLTRPHLESKQIKCKLPKSSLLQQDRLCPREHLSRGDKRGFFWGLCLCPVTVRGIKESGPALGWCSQEAGAVWWPYRWESPRGLELQWWNSTCSDRAVLGRRPGM